MSIHQLFQKSAFDPEDVRRLVAAYEKTLRKLSLTNRDDHLTRLVAKTIIRVGQTGVRDPALISKMAIEKLGLLQ